MRTTRILTVLSVLVLAVLSSGCASDRQVISQAGQFHSTLEPAVMTDAQLNGYINKVGQRILDSARELHGNRGGKADDWMFSKDMQFHFVNSKTLNAFTTGGNHMYIYNELFQQSKSEDELAAVMAHEFAHVYARHVHRGMNRQYAILGAAAAAGAAGYAAGGSEKGTEYAGLGAGAALMAGQFVGMNFTRRDESEADKLGFEFYTRAGWDPRRFGDFFKSMIDKGYDKGPDFLSDHPSLKSRYDNAQRWASELGNDASRWRRPPTANAQEFARLQAHARRVGETMPSDKTLEGSQKILAALPRSCLMPTIPEDQKKAEQEVLVASERAKKRKARR